MRFLYSISIFLYSLAVRLAAPFYQKAAQMRNGWRHWRRTIPFHRTDGAKVAWFHASSLGEFEQARPVIENFRKLHPDYKICLTFFSPSGYEIRKNYDKADLVCYLPPDTPRNARDFVKSIHPDIAFFVKYDFWFNYLDVLRKSGIPAYLFSAIFRPKQYFFRPYGRWFALQLSSYSHIFVQNQESIELLRSVGINACSIAGDTRIDRVNDIASQAKSYPEIERFINSEGERPPVLMAGSSWEPDEYNIHSFVQSYTKPLKLILAPHMINKHHLEFIEQLFSPDKCVRYSVLVRPDAEEELFHRPLLIIDNIGMLSSLYRYAHIAYIGGGFGKGIHNTLEAAIYGCPVCFGPNYQKFKEARDLIQCGGAKSYTARDNLQNILTHWLNNDDAYTSASKACKEYMAQNIGATSVIINLVENQ